MKENILKDKIKIKFNSKLGFALLALIPAFLLYIIFNILPTFEIFKMSLFDGTGLGDMKFVGFENYSIMFENSSFWRSFGNTMILMVASTILTILLSLVLAYVLSKVKMKGQSFFRVVYYIPNILSIVVIAAIFNKIFEGENGLLNTMLRAFGLNISLPWLSEEKTVLGSILFVMVWQAFGYYMVMYIAGMDNIDNEIYESADLDGARGLNKFFNITIPLTWDIIRVTLTLFIIGSINLSFLLIFPMTNGGPKGASDVLLNTMYMEAYTNGNYGYGMAIGSVLFIITFILSLVVEKLTNKDVTE